MRLSKSKVSFMAIALFLLLSLNITSGQSKVNLRQFMDNPFMEETRTAPISITDLNQLYRLIGKPLRITKTPLENQYDPKLKDFRYVLVYSTMTLVYDYFDIQDRYFRYLWLIDARKNEMRYGIHYGMTESDIRELLGNLHYPRSYSDDAPEHRLTYFVNGLGIDFVFINGALTEISIYITV